MTQYETINRAIAKLSIVALGTKNRRPAGFSCKEADDTSAELDQVLALLRRIRDRYTYAKERKR